MIVKGFKVLEAKYEESQRKLVATEEQLAAVSASHDAFLGHMEAAKQVLRDRETVRQHIWI